MRVKLQPQPIHFPPLDIWSTYFQWSWKLEERWCPGRIHPFKNECAPHYTCFSWWSSSNFSFSLSLPLAGIKQIQEVTPQWHRAEDVCHLVQNQWHPFISLEYPRHTFRCQLVHRDERWNPSFLSSQGRKVMKTLMEQSYWASCLGPKGGNVLNKAAAFVPTSESGLGTEGRE